MSGMLIDAGLTALVWLITTLLAWAFLHLVQLRGALTALVGFGFPVVLIVIMYSVAPHALLYRHGEDMPPLLSGILIGGLTPVALLLVKPYRQGDEVPSSVGKEE